MRKKGDKGLSIAEQMLKAQLLVLKIHKRELSSRPHNLPPSKEEEKVNAIYEALYESFQAYYSLLTKEENKRKQATRRAIKWLERSL